MLIGAIFLTRSAQEESLAADLYIMALMFAMSTTKVSDLYTATFGNIIALILGLVAILFPGSFINRYLLYLLGVILIWRGTVAIYSFYKQSKSGTDNRSDAHVMAQITGRSATHWAVVYGGITILILLFVVGIVVSRQKEKQNV